MNTTNADSGPIETTDEEFMDTLIAISVSVKRPAAKLSQTKTIYR